MVVHAPRWRYNIFIHDEVVEFLSRKLSNIVTPFPLLVAAHARTVTCGVEIIPTFVRALSVDNQPIQCKSCRGNTDLAIFPMMMTIGVQKVLGVCGMPEKREVFADHCGQPFSPVEVDHTVRRPTNRPKCASFYERYVTPSLSSSASKSFPSII